MVYPYCVKISDDYKIYIAWERLQIGYKMEKNCKNLIFLGPGTGDGLDPAMG